MNWQALQDPEIQNFISDHESEDVSALALQKAPHPDWPYPLILEQIKARQKAKKKIPQWLTLKGIIFPPPDLLEQASSFACAAYKASIFRGRSFADLTAGCGVDTAAFAANFQKGFAIEKDEMPAALLTHNFKMAGIDHVQVTHGTAEDTLSALPEVDLITLDPQRRDGQRRGIYALEDCSPDVLALLPELQNKAQHVLLKTSPVLDIHKTLRALSSVQAVHVVGYQGECKEVLYCMNFQNSKSEPNVPIHCVEIDDKGVPLRGFSYTQAQEKQAETIINPPLQYLYEPAPAFMKGGAYKYMAQYYGLKKLAIHTHLYTSESPVDNFPGRGFKVKALCPVRKKELKKILPGMKANLTVRNFSSNTEDLRKKLGVKDGGDSYLFACEDSAGERILILCEKI